MAVAKIGELTYDTLADAIAAANEAESATTITLVTDIAINQIYTISKDITISGSYIITRYKDDNGNYYTGTLFTVNAGASLTLDGGLIIDGGNHWVIDMETYNEDLYSMTRVMTADCEKYFTLVEGEPRATAFMIVSNGGAINLNNVTFQNNFSTNSGIVKAGANSTITLTGAKITHCASTRGNGLAVNANGANINVTMNDGTIIDGNHIGGNHGVFLVYSGALFTMNGGQITNTTGWDSNGVAIGMYNGRCIMNGGGIGYNSSIFGQNNGRNSAVYVHSNSTMIMNGGVIYCNIGKDYAGGIASYKSSSTLIVTGGSIINNVSLNNGEIGDDIHFSNGGTVEVSGGTFTQDVSQWCVDGYGVVQLPDGTWGVKTTVFQAYACVDGVISEADMYACVNGIIYKVDGIQSRLNLN